MKNANVDNVTEFAELENASQKRFEAKRQAVIERRRRRLRRDAGTHKKAKKKLSVKTPQLTDEERLQAWLGARRSSHRNRSIEERQELKVKHAKLNKRQKKLNEILKTAGDYYEGSWKEIKISDISHLTALNNVEYMVFSKGNRRIIIKGGQRGASLTGELFDKIKNEGWKLSAHTHPHITREGLQSSTDDVKTLQALNHKRSVILNAIGERRQFDDTGMNNEKIR